ncbi:MULTISPECIES: hypothetical protein [unclassified Bradyrhizobium]|uniref:hypothetical protein n=1 Tax=unclassified Bradyrhizobium TaxID=2631580 RepID=UPI0028E53F2F|nr:MULTISPECIES: hypothetical protein [unclassified Bradyrhizobium]
MSETVEGLVGEPVRPRRDWVAIGISLGSLIISAVTSINVLIPRDDVRMMIDRHPLVGLDLSTNKFKVFGNPLLTFINSGNRPAGISGLSASAQRLDSRSPKIQDCSRKDALVFSIPFDTKPFVLNPGEIKVVEAAIAIPSGVEALFTWITAEKDGIISIPRSDFKEGDRILICIQLNLATPDSFVKTWQQLAYTIKLESNVGQFTALFEENKPIVIKKSSLYDLDP